MVTALHIDDVTARRASLLYVIVGTLEDVQSFDNTLPVEALTTAAGTSSTGAGSRRKGRRNRRSGRPVQVDRAKLMFVALFTVHIHFHHLLCHLHAFHRHLLRTLLALHTCCVTHLSMRDLPLQAMPINLI